MATGNDLSRCATCLEPDQPVVAIHDGPVWHNIPYCQPHHVVSEQAAHRAGVVIQVRYVQPRNTSRRRVSGRPT